MAADQSNISNPLTEIPENLRRALDEEKAEPLVLIAAARVLRRCPWEGDARMAARSYLSAAPEILREEIQKPQFFPLRLLRRELRSILASADEEDRERARRVLNWAIKHFRTLKERGSLSSDERMAVEEALRFLNAEVTEDTCFSQAEIRLLSPEDTSYLVTGGFARSAFEAYDSDPQARQGLGNQIARIASPIRGRFRPSIMPLFQVYLSLFRPAMEFWVQWQEEFEGKELPNFIPAYAGHLSVSWQVAWAASAAGPGAFLRFLERALETGDARQRLAALNFTELAIRYGYEQGTPEFGGGTVAPDVAGIEGGFGDTLVIGKVSIGSAPAPQPAEGGELAEGSEEGAVTLDANLRTLPGETAAFEVAPSAEKSVKEPIRPAPASKEPSKEGTGEHAIPASAPAASVAAAKSLAEPGKRYADFTFYRRSSRGQPRAKVGPQETLAKTEAYDLEVAVRAKISGIPLRRPKARVGITEPRQGEPVEILVIASSEDFEIPEPVQRLLLPPLGDSVENAVFKEVSPRRTTGSKDDLAKINVRLLYNLNLIEHVVIEAEVVASLGDPATSKLGLEDPVSLDQDLSLREYRNLELIQPRQMNILVKGIQGGFELTFTLLREGSPDVVLPGATRVLESSLEGTLAGIRRTLLGISVWDEFATGIACEDETKFQKGLRDLAKDGRDMWTKLFELNVDSSLSNIGQLLMTNPLQERSLIQVSIARSASSFVLPWNLLYDHDPDAEPVDPKGFWGLRYRIEQETEEETEKDDKPTVLLQPLEIGFLISRFQEAALQEKFLDEMASASKGRIATVHAIDTAKDALDYLQNHTKQFVFFFAHGHTQFPEATRVGASEADFLTQYEKLPKKSPLRKTWMNLYESVRDKKYDSDKSWIKLQHGKLFLLDLYAKIGKKFTQAPLVFLNMCESAQLTPSLQESFIHLFLNRGARAVIGTECSMRPLFAHHFAKKLLKGILSGEAVGDVMLEARVDFMGKNNPLGLAYTLFGSPLTRFEPPPLAKTEAPEQIL